MKIKIFKTNSGSDLAPPAYASVLASGMDIRSAIDAIIQPGKFVIVPAGFCIAIPYGYEGQIRPRSGLAAKHGISVLNTPGTIDSDYRGEVKVIVVNFGLNEFYINKGDRIAQLVITPVIQAELEEVSSLFDLDSTSRGNGGFGHTGKK